MGYSHVVFPLSREFHSLQNQLQKDDSLRISFNKRSINNYVNVKSPYLDSSIPLRNTAGKMKFFIKDFFSKCDKIHRKLRIWSHLLKKSLIGNFIFCAVQRSITIHYVG